MVTDIQFPLFDLVGNQQRRHATLSCLTRQVLDSQISDVDDIGRRNCSQWLRCLQVRSCFWCWKNILCAQLCVPNSIRIMCGAQAPILCCKFAISYNPDLASDPYGEEGCIWSFNYFFYNKKIKRIVFFSCRAATWVLMSHLWLFVCCRCQHH